MKSLVLFLINYYQKTFSKDHSANSLVFCKFTPSCSEYAKQAFSKYKFWTALKKSLWRIIRCNPWNKGGIDIP